MGYILPVQQDTYRNYQYRMYKEDRSPHEIQGVRMVTFIPIQEEVDFYKQRQHDENPEKRAKETSKIKPTHVLTYKITPDEEKQLSGKGHHVNLKV